MGVAAVLGCVGAVNVREIRNEQPHSPGQRRASVLAAVVTARRAWKGTYPMSDVVVTVPLSFGLDRWIDEGDAAGEPWTGQLWNLVAVRASRRANACTSCTLASSGAMRRSSRSSMTTTARTWC